MADVSESYDKIVTHGEWWRIFSSSFSHMSLTHLGFNTFTLYVNMGIWEYVGVMLYVYCIFRAMDVDSLIICSIVLSHYYWCIRKPWSSSIMIYNIITITISLHITIILTISCLSLHLYIYIYIGRYSLGQMETVYGSVEYAYLSLDLVVITILLCLAMTWAMERISGDERHRYVNYEL